MEVVKAPAKGVWRVGRAPDPLSVPPPLTKDELDNARVGNRFDSALGHYSVVYFGTNLDCCFGETLSRFRPDLEVVETVGEEWPKGFMEIGAIPAEWRTHRAAVRVKFPRNARFLDIESLETRQQLRMPFAETLVAYGHDDLDLGTVMSQDRRVTRAMSQWAYQHALDEMLPIAGIRYVSRLNLTWEAWAVFDHVPMTEQERLTITTELPALKRIAKSYDLIIH